MEENELREFFRFKISQELNWFRLAVLNKKPDEIYAMAYQIDTMINIYELMLEMSTDMDSATLHGLIHIHNPMTYLYELWLKYEDGRMEELQGFLVRAVKDMENAKSA